MTRKIGRYAILGPLATGGMAEILLARLVGPSGFERPVVLKRIRPDLDHNALTSLFLEEARLAAKIRHANVVAVEDLGTDDGAPYLVMEYLEGESLSNVARRLVSRDEPLPFGLAAYVIAEACAGLHAAHELRSSDEQLVGLVHRDVSPQNVFVTYDGAVKVVDFGIAMTDATSDTETDEIRGKSAYLAPEQLTREPLDRRTDVFALGIVLYELLTGHRLFKRFSQAATIRAILTDPIVTPTRVSPDVPAALEAICMRALARPLDDRYATAAEMRRELLLAMRPLASEEPSAELAELMRRCFPDRIAEKRELLRSVREGSVVDHIPVGDIDVTIEIPGLPAFEEALASAAAALQLPPLLLAPPPSPRHLPAPPPSPPLLSSLDLPASREPAPALAAPTLARARRRRAWVLPAVLIACLLGAVVLRFRGVRRVFARSEVPGTSAPTSASASTSAVSVTNAPVSTETSSGVAPPGSASLAADASPPAPGPTTASTSLVPRKPRGPTAAPPTAAPPTAVGPVVATPAPTPAPAAPSASGRGFRRFQ